MSWPVGAGRCLGGGLRRSRGRDRGAPHFARPRLVWAVPALLLACSGAAAAAPGGAHRTAPAEAAPVVWRLCSGTEEGALIPLPAGSGTPAVLMHLSHPMAGSHLTALPVRGPKGNDLILVRFSAPAGARPGHYEGMLTVRHGTTLSRRPARIELLPFELMGPSKQYAVSRVPVTSVACCLTEEADAASLRRLHELGIGALCLSAPPADRAPVEVTMRSAGLHGPVLAPFQPSDARRRTGEADDSRPPAAPAIRWYALCTGRLPNAKTLAALKAHGTLVACPVADGGAPEGTDLAIFDAAGSSGERLRRGGLAAAGAPGWWRWDAGEATPLENRLRCGAWLWKSGLSGALVDIDAEAPAGPDWPLRWEGVRQGVLDSRYLTTLYSLIRQVKDMDRSSRLPGQAQAAVAAALNRLAEHPTAEGADRMRALTIAWILRLGRVVWS